MCLTSEMKDCLYIIICENVYFLSTNTHLRQRHTLKKRWKHPRLPDISIFWKARQIHSRKMPKNTLWLNLRIQWEVCLYLYADFPFCFIFCRCSSVKVYCWQKCEAVKLYNTATAIVIFLSLIISLQLSCTVTKRLYYVFMQDINGWLTFYIAPWILPAMMCMGVACCMAVYLIQMKRINKIPMSKELKCMD